MPALRRAARPAWRAAPEFVRLVVLFTLRLLRYPLSRTEHDASVLHAFWDFQSQPYALGDIITWHVKTCIEARKQGKDVVDIHVLADPQQPASRGQRVSITSFNYMGYLTDLLPAFFVNPMMKNFRLYYGREDFEKQYYNHVARQNSVRPAAPKFFAGYVKCNAFDPYQRTINEFYREHGDFPRPQVPASTRRWARTYLATQKEKFVICLHLRARDVALDAAQANVSRDATMGNWLEFLELLGRKYPNVLVVALGRPGEWPRAFFRLANVVILKTQGYGLLEELALIEEADLFLGTVSGPAEYAYFGRSPYIIVDTEANHPHSAAIRCIPASATQSPFATPHQQLHWGACSSQDLLALFEGAYQRLGHALEEPHIQ